MMTIECPDCDAKLQAPEELIGRKAKCPECGTSFPIKCFAKSGPPPLPNAKDWYYAIGGQRTGPVDPREVGRLIMSGQIQRETVVWSEGMAEWLPAWQTEFGTLFGPAEPPPLTGQHVGNGLAWTVALVPLLNVPTLGMLPWWVFFALNTIFCLVDERRLKRAGHTAPFVGWAFLVPVYLFIRASRTKQRPDYAYVWLLCFVGSLLLVAAMQAG